MTVNQTKAVNHLAACEASIASLKDLHANPRGLAGPIELAAHRRSVAEHYDTIRQATGLARVHALLHIGAQLEKIAERLDDGRLSLEETENLIGQVRL